MRRLLALVLLTVSAALAVPAPAGAGGPTSVLITDPSSARASALYYSDARYEELATLVARGARLDGEPSGLGGDSVNLTWMAHDVSPWQTQQVYLGAEGGAVVVTYPVTGAGAATWRRVADPQALVRLLDRTLRPGATAAEPAAVEPVATERVVTETVVADAAWWSLSGWRWLVPGLLLGAGLTLLGARWRTRDTEPRQVLVDVRP